MKSSSTLRHRRTISAAVIIAFAGGLAATQPALAAPRSFDSAKLDNAPAEYTQWRRGGWRGNRGAAIAAGVGLGILGAAAIASSQRAYAQPYYGSGYYGGPYYGNSYYAEPVYYERPAYYAPQPYYAPAPAYVYDEPAYYGHRRYGPRPQRWTLPDGRPDPARLR